MKATFLRKVLKYFAFGWMAAAAILAALTLSGVLSKALFQKVFVIGFIAFAVFAGLLSAALAEMDKRKGPDSEDSHSE